MKNTIAVAASIQAVSPALTCICPPTTLSVVNVTSRFRLGRGLVRWRDEPAPSVAKPFAYSKPRKQVASDELVYLILQLHRHGFIHLERTARHFIQNPTPPPPPGTVVAVGGSVVV